MKKIEWVKSEYNFITYEHFAKIYRLMAKAALLAKKDFTDNDKLTGDDKWRFESGMIFIPIIYCIRHSIELFLKSLCINLSGKYPNTHDLCFIKKYLDQQVPALVETDLTILVQKYADYKISGTPIFSKDTKVDSSNEFFRYPDNAMNLKIKGEELSHIEETDLLKDIGNLENQYSRISVLVQTSPPIYHGNKV